MLGVLLTSPLAGTRTAVRVGRLGLVLALGRNGVARTLLLGLMLRDVLKTDALFLLIAVHVSGGVRMVPASTRREVIGHGVAERFDELAIGHAAIQACGGEELLDATRTKEVAHAPRETLDAVRTSADIDAVARFEQALDRLVIVIERIAILQRREFHGVGRIGKMPRIVRHPPDLGKGLGSRIVDGGALQLVAARHDIFEHGVLRGIETVDRLDEGNQRVTAIELVIAHRVVSVPVGESLIVVAVALETREVLHLVRDAAHRGRVHRSQFDSRLGHGSGLILPAAIEFARRGQVLKRCVICRVRARRGGDRGNAQTTKGERKGQTSNDSLVTRLCHESSLI